MAKTLNDQCLDKFQTEFVRLLQGMTGRFRAWDLFRDFVELAAITCSRLDLQQFEVREARYLEIVKKYSRAELDNFCRMLAQVTLSLESGLHDCLGALYMALDFGDDCRGQFFTPYSVCQLMAQITLGEKLEDLTQGRDYFTVLEPAVGAGATVIAAAEVVLNAGGNFQQCMHVTAVDIDPVVVYMAYIQFSLIGLPAVVVHGNSLTAEQWGVWYTPFHIMGGWSRRLARRDQATTPASVDQRGSDSLNPIPVFDPAPSSFVSDMATPAKTLPALRGHKDIQLGLFD